VTAPLDLADFGDLALMAVAAVGVHPRVLIDPADALALYNEAKRLAAEVERLAALVAEVERLTKERDTARSVVDFFVEAAKRDGYEPGYYTKPVWAAMLEVQAANVRPVPD